MGTHCNDGAPAPGLAATERVQVTPQSTTPAGGPALQGNHENELGNCAGSDGDRKAVITMMAHAAQAGCTLHELASGSYLLCRWGMAKELPCLRAVGALLRRIGGAR
jgi:hypothetical protein